jgi:Helicase associated domain
MPRSDRISNIARWETGFAALCRFRARVGHCCPSRHHVEGKFPLGSWVVTQRYYLSKGRILPERKRRLDAIGFVWDWHDYLWEQNFAALLKFKKRKGHCRVPIPRKPGNTLAYWVTTQRRNRWEMSAERRARLNKIGFAWRGSRGQRHI